MVRKLLVITIRIYQQFSKIKGPSCRFYPTCSHYAIAAIEKHGALKGTWLAVIRISKCHPFNSGGYDPVP